MIQTCPSCGKVTEVRVVDSRTTASIQTAGTRFAAPCCIRRQRECQACGSRWTTYEILEVQASILIRDHMIVEDMKVKLEVE